MRLLFSPLFFLPRRALCWAYEQARFERLLDTPFGWLFAVVDRGGIWFQYKGDEVLWTWFWTRKGLAPYISTLFSGTGEFWDARFWTLKEIDDLWETYSKSLSFIKMEAAEDLDVGDLVCVDGEGKVRKAT